VKVLSSGKNDFNFDYEVAFHETDTKITDKLYNYGKGGRGMRGEYSGLSVFRLGLDNQIYHTYSTYSRGIDLFNSGNMLLDRLPHGRNGYIPLKHLT